MKFVLAVVFAVASLLLGASLAPAEDMMDKDMMMEHTTGVFSGAKVNGGTATHLAKDGQNILTLSDDFKPPQTPDPHWQVVDSKGNIYQLQKLNIKGDKYNKAIVVPAYVPDIVKVQIWCAFAETLLGEASFQKPMMMMEGMDKMK
ncbi:hypothetical protein L0222_15480 [bacterium]|nr:hypothetical protein [bacterium]MCI0603217.1 hypothetical protein [bacterium]